MNPPRFRSISVLGVVVISIIALGCTSDRQVIRQAVDAHAQLEPAVMEDEVLANYIQEVGDRIIEQAAKASARGDGPKKHFEGDNSWMFGPEMKFHFVNSKTLNAFTTGGEHMYIYTQLFVECKTEDELAAVMAHEFAHIYGRHVQKGMDRQYALLAAAAGGAAAGAAVGGRDNWAEGAAVGGGATLALGSFANMGFTRGDEAEADKYGFEFYTRAGWDPEHFGDFFQAMIDKGYDKTPGILSDHPTLASRVDKARERAADLPPDAADWRRDPVASPSRFKELQNRAVKLGKSVPSDSSLEGAKELLAALPRSCVSPLPEFEDQRQAQEDILRNAEARKKRSR